MKTFLFNPSRKTDKQHRTMILNCVKKKDLLLGHPFQLTSVGLDKFHLKLFVPVGTPKTIYEKALVEGSFKKNTVKRSVIFLPFNLFQECVPGSVEYIQVKIEQRH
ncbi:MAG: hypothetical protein EOO52_12700 [Gammaproteobacteria bacterium]|nr:MAG: hypothetical protein EOO52_12700 [Gammaproteobacteria bacterium]